MSSQDPGDRRPMGRFAHLMSATSGQKSSDESGITKKEIDDEPRPATGRGRMFAALAVSFCFFPRFPSFEIQLIYRQKNVL